jgi:hypothetical protein
MNARAKQDSRLARGLLAAVASAGMLTLFCEGASANNSVQLWPLLNLSAQYTDNLLLAPNARSDEVATLVGGASLALNNSRRRFSLDYLTDGQLYTEHSNFDRLAKDHYVGLHDQEAVRDFNAVDFGHFPGRSIGVRAGADRIVRPQPSAQRSAPAA